MGEARTSQTALSQKDYADQPGTSVSVGGASTVVAAANPDRAEITVTNDHATQIVYLRLEGAAAVLNQGIRLNAAGGSWTSNAYTGEVRGIATGAATITLVVEV